jgi:DNA-binding LacI/PurR family transcriptional regulator
MAEHWQKSFSDLLDAYLARLEWDTQALRKRMAALGNVNDYTEKSLAKLRRLGGNVESARRLFAAIGQPKNLTRFELQQLASALVIPDDVLTVTGARLIGLFVPDIDRLAIWGRLAGGFIEVAHKQNFAVVIQQHHEDIRDLKDMIDAFLRNFHVSGLVIAPARGKLAPSTGLKQLARGHYDDLKKGRIPVVIISREDPSLADFPFVGIQNMHFAKTATLRLMRQKHTRIAAIFSSQLSSTQAARRDGFVAAYAEPVDQITKREPTPPTPPIPVEWLTALDDPPDDSRRDAPITQAKEFATRLLAREAPTAFLCGASYVAAGVIQAIEEYEREHGAGGFAVVTFDDDMNLDASERPRTVITYKPAEFAAAALKKIDLLITNYDDEEALAREMVPMAFDPQPRPRQPQMELM